MQAIAKVCCRIDQIEFPPEEKFRLADQIVRSSRGVTACIGEGHGRFHYKESVQYCRMARGSLMETLEHLIIAFDEGYITADALKEMKTRVDTCGKLLNGYISYLQRAKSPQDEGATD